MRLLLICFLLVPFLGFTQKSIEQTLREEILNNEFDGPQIIRFFEMTHNIENPGSVVKAYQAVSEAFMARVAWNPYSKIVYLRKSKEIFEGLLAEEPDNLEVRFLRFSTQAGIPEFMGLSKEMSKDKDLIVSQLDKIDDHQIDDALFNFMVDFISKSKYCTSKDLALLSASKKKRFG